MASPGLGYRTAADVLCEVSLHLLQPICYTTISAFYLVGGWGTGGWGVYGWGTGPTTLQLASTANLYIGAQIILGWGLDTAEVVTVIGFGPSGYIFTTTPVNSHDPGETVLSPTFPYEAANGDPAFSQSEMLGYLSRAQNETLSEVPTYYALTQQAAVFGQIFQDTPANCIEINRVAISQTYIAIASLTRASNTVTLASVDPHGLGAKSTIFVQNSAAGWGGVFEVLTVPSPTTLTYKQVASDDSTTGGAILYWKRAYETTQAEISMTNRTWQNGYVTSPSNWFEDRTGLYRWGVGGKPASNYPLELLCSVRDTDTLGLLDGFLLPDLLVGPVLKYKVLAYAFSKDGIQQDPARARYCDMRWRKGVMAIQRYLEGFDLGLKQEMANA